MRPHSALIGDDRKDLIRAELQRMVTVRSATEAREVTDTLVSLGCDLADTFVTIQQLRKAQGTSATVPPAAIDKLAEELCQTEKPASAAAHSTLAFANEVMFFMSIREGAAAFEVVDHLLQNMARHADALAEGNWGRAGPFWAALAEELRDRLAEPESKLH
jgi:hypothetical protein